MPVGSVGKLLVLGTLVAALGAGGCKEDEEETPDTGLGNRDSGMVTPDAGGGTDSGARDAGPADTGPAVDSAAPPVTCGTPAKTCEAHEINPALPKVAAGCAKNAADAEVCGISSMSLLMGADPKFLEKDAPGVASASCGAFLDGVEPALDAGTIPDGGGKQNGVFDTQTTILGTIQVLLKYPGCCTPRGYCSVNGGQGMSSVMGGAYMPSNNGYGCVESTHMFRTAPPLQMVPCDPDSGMIMLPAGDGGSDGGASDAGADGGNG